MPEETKNKVSSYETPNNAIAYASDIPWVNQTNQRVQPPTQGEKYPQINGFKKSPSPSRQTSIIQKTTECPNPNQGPLCQPGRNVRLLAN